MSRIDWEELNISPDKKFIGAEFRNPKLPFAPFVASSPTKAHKKMALSTNYVDAKTKKGWSPLLTMTYPAHRQAGPPVSALNAPLLSYFMLFLEPSITSCFLTCRVLIVVLLEVLPLPKKVSGNNGKRTLQPS